MWSQSRTSWLIQAMIENAKGASSAQSGSLATRSGGPVLGTGYLYYTTLSKGLQPQALALAASGWPRSFAVELAALQLSKERLAGSSAQRQGMGFRQGVKMVAVMGMQCALFPPSSPCTTPHITSL